MERRPAVGAVGRATSLVAPDGEAEFDGASFPVRVQAGRIEPGRPVLVTGFDPWSLLVREASPEEVDAQATAAPPVDPGPATGPALRRVGVVVFGALFLAGGLLSFVAGDLAVFGYLVAVAGQWWLFILMTRECQQDAVILALVIPFFTWYFAWQRWDVAKWPFLVNVVGIVLFLLVECAGR